MEYVNALQLFKCLADTSRLQILRSLFKEDMYVERLAERLNLSAATISSHLRKLEKIGAVKSRKEQYYTVYALCPDVFSHRVIDLIRDSGGGDSEDRRDEEYRKKILSTFMADGIITKMPAQLKKKLVLIEEICRAFEIGKPYTEKEVNLIVAGYYEDFCMVRRYFVDYGLFTRDKGIYCKRHEKIGGIH
jgi:biotin operon repressor